MLCSRRRPVLLLLAAAAPLAGMDIDDLRLEYAPIGGKQFDAGGEVAVLNLYNAPAEPQHQEVGTDAYKHTRLSLDYRRSLTDLRAGFGSLVWGFELADDIVRERQANISYRGRSFMIDAFLGWAWKLTPAWHVEQGFLVGCGRTRWTQDIQGYYLDGTDWNDESEGFSYEYGIDLASYYTIARHVQFGIDVRDMFLTSHTRFVGNHFADPSSSDAGDVTQSSADWKLTIEGVNLAAVLGFRF